MRSLCYCGTKIINDRSHTSTIQGDTGRCHQKWGLLWKVWLLTSTYCEPSWGWWAQRIKHFQNHAMLWSPWNIWITRITTKKIKFHNRVCSTYHMQIGAFKLTKIKFFKSTAMEGWDVTLDNCTEPRRQTCILHLTRSRGTTAVCVVPQLRIPPKPHRTKYFWEPNSQLSPSKKHRSDLKWTTHEMKDNHCSLVV